MTRRALLGGLGSCLALKLSCVRRDLAHGSAPPHVLVIVLDTLRAASLPMYGGERPVAPFLASLAERSTSFRRCYSAATWTVPSVASLFSGLPPLVHGVITPRVALPASLPTFPRALRERGYQTGFFTAQIMIGEGFGAERHFDYVSYDAVDSRDGRVLLAAFEKWARARRNGPVLAYLHFFQPHGPYLPGPQSMERHAQLTAVQPLSSAHLNPAFREVDIALNELTSFGRVPWYQGAPIMSHDPLVYLARYEAHIGEADRCVAMLFDLWERLRNGERTVYVITADHGESLGEHGHMFDHAALLADTLLHVPLLVHDTDSQQAAVCEDVVSHLDLAAGVVSLADAEDPKEEGKSLFFHGANAVQTGRQLALSQHPDQHGQESGWALTSGPWRLVYNDCPSFGNHLVMRVRHVNPEHVRPQRLPLPMPKTVLTRSVTLANDIILDRFSLHVPYVMREHECDFSGHVDGTAEGSLHLRARDTGTGAVVELQYTELEPKGEFAGTLPGIAGRPDSTWMIEASWNGREWRAVVIFPLCEQRPLTSWLALLGATFDPPFALPGQYVRVFFLWRALGKADTDIFVHTSWLDKHGVAVYHESRRFFARDGDKEANALSASDIPTGWRFDEAYWYRVPETLPPGEYRLRVQLSHQAEETTSVYGETILAGTLTVLASREEWVEDACKRFHPRHVLRALSDAGAYLDRDFTMSSATLKVLERALPEEGHVEYLASRVAPTVGEQQERLRDCLTKTPWHRRALEATGAVLPEIVPPHPLPHVFQTEIALLGYDWVRGNNSGEYCYLTLYWEALSPLDTLYAARLIVQNGAVNKEWQWFLGAGIRPTTTWLVGEVIVETVRFPIAEPDHPFRLFLRLFPRWQAAYAGWRNHFFLEIRGADGRVVPSVQWPETTVHALAASDEDYLSKKRRELAFYQLYQLEDDPLEQRNMIHQQPEIVAEMQALLLQQLGEIHESASPPQRDISDQTLNALKAIGYLAD